MVPLTSRKNHRQKHNGHRYYTVLDQIQEQNPYLTLSLSLSLLYSFKTFPPFSCIVGDKYKHYKKLWKPTQFPSFCCLSSVFSLLVLSWSIAVSPMIGRPLSSMAKGESSSLAPFTTPEAPLKYVYYLFYMPLCHPFLSTFLFLFCL